MMARLYSGIWILPSKKKRCKVGPPLAKLSGSSHGLYIMRQSFVTTAQCFTPVPEQDGDMHSLVNVHFFYFYIVSTMWRKCCGLIDKHGSAV